MKVRLLVDCEGPNPEFDPQNPRKAPHTIPRPAGTEIEHPDAHQLCERGFANAKPLAEPIDAEARARHADYLVGYGKRVEELRKLANDPENPPDPETKHGAHLIALAKAYGVWEGAEGDDANEE